MHVELCLDLVQPDDPEAARLLRAYLTDVIIRYPGPPVTPEQIAGIIAATPFGDLAAPSGMLLVARLDRRAVACAGLRTVTPVLGEVKRVYVDPPARGRGIAVALLTGLERLAAARGMTHLRLDTRPDLVEAIALYRRLGYTDVEPFNDDPYAGVWMGKALRPRQA